MMLFMGIIALLFAQTLPLHAHNPQEHHKQLERMGVLDGHEHHSEIHIDIFDMDDEEHKSQNAIDLSAQAVVKNIKFSDLPVAALIILALLVIPLLCGARRWPAHYSYSLITRGIAFRPPLRAPPL